MSSKVGLSAMMGMVFAGGLSENAIDVTAATMKIMSNTSHG